MQLAMSFENFETIDATAYVPPADFIERHEALDRSCEIAGGGVWALTAAAWSQASRDLLLGLFVARCGDLRVGLAGRRENVRKGMQGRGEVGAVPVGQMQSRVDAVIACASLAGFTDYPTFEKWQIDVARESLVGTFIRDALTEIGLSLPLTAESLPELRRETHKRTAGRLRAAALFVQAFGAAPRGLEEETRLLAGFDSTHMRKAQKLAQDIENEEETLENYGENK